MSHLFVLSMLASMSMDQLYDNFCKYFGYSDDVAERFKTQVSELFAKKHLLSTQAVLRCVTEQFLIDNDWEILKYPIDDLRSKTGIAAAPKRRKTELPEELPQLVGRVVHGGDNSISYSCNWGGAECHDVSLMRLMEKYGDKIAGLVETWDAENNVQHEIEKLVAETKDGMQFKVRWLGYPPVFDTWSPWADLGDDAERLTLELADKMLDKLRY